MEDVMLGTFGGLLVIFFSCFDEEAAIESEELISLHIMKEHVYNMLLFCRLRMLTNEGEE
jgi:flagellar biosynthesis regulator FlbT